jgi:hypothetical protein
VKRVLVAAVALILGACGAEGGSGQRVSSGDDEKFTAEDTAILNCINRSIAEDWPQEQRTACIKNVQTGGTGVDPAPEPEPQSEPKGRYGLASCVLGESDKLIGSTEVRNTGEVPLTAETSFKWQLGDGSWIKADSKMVKVGAGGDKLVFFQTPADLDTQLSFQDHPEYFDGTNCKTKVTIIK